MPPKLEYHPPEPAEPHRSWILELLDHTCGPACVVDGDGVLQLANALWHEQIAKAVRPDLAECAVTGGTFLNLFAEESQRAAVEKILTQPADESAKPFAAVSDLGHPARPFVVRFFLRSLPSAAEQPRILVQTQDVTPEHVVRFALLDREHKLRDARALLTEQHQKLQQTETDVQTLREQNEADVRRLGEQFQADLARVTEQQQTERAQLIAEREADSQAAARQHQNEIETVVARRDEDVLQLLTIFAGDPRKFAASFCQAAARSVQASALLLSAGDQNSSVKDRALSGPLSELFDAADHPWQTVAQTVLQANSAVKFDHLAAGEDRDFWLAAGIGCVWAFPLPDETHTSHVLLLLFPEDDALLPVELYARLHVWCQLGTLLLRASQSFVMPAAPAIVEPVTEIAREPEQPKPMEISSHLRVLTAGLAEEFGNLLTGVLGHSSLAVAELGENHTALGDVRAIEKAARGAARLTRQLLAISGALHRTQTALDLSAYLKHYVQQDHSGAFSNSTMPDEPCPVHAETSALEIILDGLCDHLRAGDGLQWLLSASDNAAILTLTSAEQLPAPIGWESGLPGAHLPGGIPEIFFAREAARALGGDVNVTVRDDFTAVTLTLPLVAQKISS